MLFVQSESSSFLTTTFTTINSQVSYASPDSSFRKEYPLNDDLKHANDSSLPVGLLFVASFYLPPSGQLLGSMTTKVKVRLFTILLIDRFSAE